VSAASLFDRQVPLADEGLLRQEGQLLGFEERYRRMSGQLRLLMHVGELEAWSKKHHKSVTRICGYVGDQYPLVIFHGDVGTGKTVTAECMANRLVTEDARATDSELFKLSTRVRGSGKVGEMGTLINEAFQQVLKSAGKSRRAFLIIDEGDSLAAARSQEHSHHEDKVGVNTVIQNIDDLKQYGGRVLVILCTNRLRVMDPAVLRRAAIIEHFTRPTDAERLELFRADLSDLSVPEAELGKLVRATGANGKQELGWTYSDIRTRLYPNALAKAFPDNPLSISHLIEAAGELDPSPAIEDL
jgi:SpoVK/Ycf46/Vps4 family AAA+-type ATPase